MKRLMYVLFFVLLTSGMAYAQQAKYVFYFIGDGMGVNQVNGTEMYLAEQEGRIGVKPLLFTSFPVASMATTFSATNSVTDSSAAGTALATGAKTYNGAIGMDDNKSVLQSVAERAKKSGKKVGVTTSVSVDHATPAAFYAHQPDRGMYYEIALDLPKAGFDFYAGSDFMQPTGKKNDSPSLYDECRQAGYTLVRGYKQFQKQAAKAQKMILLQTEEASKTDRASLPYAIDRKKSDLTLQQITRAGIKFLTQQAKNGFFLMVEGGKIDWACHSNDAATVFHEVIDMDQAIRVAYEFYEQHPDETLIVVTADHETGGISLGCGPYELHTDVLRYQRMSAEAYGKHIKALHEKLGNKLTWEKVQADLKANWGFGESVKLSDTQTKRLHAAYENLMKGSAGDKKSLYAHIDALSDTARAIMAECALIGWQSGGHSNGYVPVFAIGAGAEAFHGQMDNTQIPQIIARAAGWQAR